jgi:hypothetical protein
LRKWLETRKENGRQIAKQIICRIFASHYAEMCHYWHMPRRSSTDRDFSVTDRRVVERTIGQQLNGQMHGEGSDTRNPHAVALGKLGGNIGGKARARALTKDERHRIASLAANARWHGRQEANGKQGTKI